MKHFILSVDEINKLQMENEAYKQSEQEAGEIIAELKAENEKLKEEVETRDNLVEHFRKEAINWAKISNDCIKDIEKYKQTLQEIKAIVCGNYEIIDPQGRKDILKLITKAEEE